MKLFRNLALVLATALAVTHCASTKHTAKRTRGVKAKPVALDTIENEDYAFGSDADQKSVFNKIGSDRRYGNSFGR
jgi:hypothetical protein